METDRLLSNRSGEFARRSYSSTASHTTSRTHSGGVDGDRDSPDCASGDLPSAHGHLPGLSVRSGKSRRIAAATSSRDHVAAGGIDEMEDVDSGLDDDAVEDYLMVRTLRSIEGSRDFTIIEALDNNGIGPFHYRLVFVIGLISVATGLGSTGFALFPPVARCHLHLSSLEEAVLTSSGFLGAACGGVVMGYLATRLGRRRQLVIMIVWIAVAGFASGIVANYYWLLALRFVVGLGHGGTGQRVSILFENIPSRHRMLGAAVLTCCFNVGNFLEAMAIKFLIPTGASVAWRYVLFTDASMFALCVVFQCWIAESPYYLLNIRGDRDAALKQLQRAARMNGKTLPAGRLVSEEEKSELSRLQKRCTSATSQSTLLGGTPERSSSPDHSRSPRSVGSDGVITRTNNCPEASSAHSLHPASHTKSPAAAASLADFTRNKELRRTTALLVVSWVTLAVAMVGCTIMIEEVLQERQSTHGKCTGHFDVFHGGKCDQLSSSDYTPIILIFLSEFLALFTTYYSAKILGRRVALTVSFVMSGIFFALLLICPVSLGVTTFLLAGCRMSVTTAWSLMIIYTAEVYPTYMRGIAVGVSRTLYRVGCVMVPFISQVLLRKSTYASKGLHAGVCALTGLMLLLLPIETKNRHLEER
ncbi:putative transporter SVOPL [Sycon ciliatum]|uniref:putative transporter SVOPL n=1 Tax=Sycon ciliatum TaxID=27933 RepID=UPI0031F6B431